MKLVATKKQEQAGFVVVICILFCLVICLFAICISIISTAKKADQDLVQERYEQFKSGRLTDEDLDQMSIRGELG